MYKISIEKDSNVVIIFLDSITCIPGLLEGGTSIGSVGTAMQRTFINLFNRNYSSIAEKVRIGRNSVILVKAIYNEDKMGEQPPVPKVVTSKEAKIMEKALIVRWRQTFRLTDTEIKKFLHDTMKKHFVIK